MQVTTDTNLGDLAKSYPQCARIMTDYGLHCVGCALNSFDTVGMGAKIHGLTDDEVEEMVVRLNEVAKG